MVGALDKVSEGLEKILDELKIKRQNRDHLNYSIVEIGQSTSKNLRALGRLVVLQSPVKDQLTLMQKNSQ